MKVKLGDVLHAVLCAAGYNLPWLTRSIVRMGLKGVFTRFHWFASVLDHRRRTPMMEIASIPVAANRILQDRVIVDVAPYQTMRAFASYSRQPRAMRTSRRPS